MKATFAYGFLFIGSLMSAVGFASEAVSFRTTQASVQLPTITTWLDITDEMGQKIEAVKPEQLSATVGSYAAEAKEVKPFSELHNGTAFIFLIDISKSLKTQPFEQLQLALNTWIDGMHEHDRATLISFGSQVKVLQDFSADKVALKQRVDKLTPSDMDTFLYQGLVQAFEQSRRQDAELPKRRVIVVLTDGIDDAAGGVTKEEVFLKMSENRIPIYAIGFALPPLTQDKVNGLKELGVLARTSGGHFLKADSMSLTEAYALQKKRIVNSYELLLTCNACKAEGQLSRLNVTFHVGDRTLSDGLDIRLLPQNKVTPKGKQTALDVTGKINSAKKMIPQKFNYLPWAALLIVLLLTLLVLLRLMKRRKIARESAKEASAESPESESSEKADLGVKQEVPLSAKYRLSLTVVRGAEPGKCFSLVFNNSAGIGRASNCDLIIDDSEISSRHAEIKVDKGILVIKDLNSMNGTLINGVPIHTLHYLQDGDQILIGRTELRLNGLEDNHAD
ncbi:MAG: VWA domain-containing protein [Methylococcaceae bacterium]|nr:VWA domain-containing protein [Methylococcaceae bacterium]